MQDGSIRHRVKMPVDNLQRSYLKMCGSMSFKKNLENKFHTFQYVNSQMFLCSYKIAGIALILSNRPIGQSLLPCNPFVIYSNTNAQKKSVTSHQTGLEIMGKFNGAEGKSFTYFFQEPLFHVFSLKLRVNSPEKMKQTHVVCQIKGLARCTASSLLLFFFFQTTIYLNCSAFKTT